MPIANNDKRTPAIVFDFGGVLMDWNPHYLYDKLPGYDHEKATRFLQEVDFYNWNLQNDRGRPFAETTAELSARFPQYRELIRTYDERYLESIGGTVEPVVRVIQALKAAGYPLYGLSNWPAEKFALVRPQYPIFEAFDEIVISGEVKIAKPERAIFEALLRRSGRRAEECLLIDDSEANIQAAKELGFQAIRFQSPEQMEAELRARGILVGARG